MFTYITFASFDRTDIRFGAAVEEDMDESFSYCILIEDFIYVLGGFFPFFSYIEIRLLDARIDLLSGRRSIYIIDFFSSALRFIYYGDYVDDDYIDRFKYDSRAFSSFCVQRFGYLILSLYIRDRVRFEFLRFQFMDRDEFRNCIDAFFL